MSRILHIWFDVDDTLYVPSPDLKKERMNRMYDCLAALAGSTREETIKPYDESYEKYEAHNKVFTDFLGDTHRGLRESQIAYSGFDTTKFLQRDERLVELFSKIDKRNIPYSLHSNNSRRMIARILYVLGLVEPLPGKDVSGLQPPSLFDPRAWEDDGFVLTRFKYVVAAGTFPKGSDPSAFRRVMEFSKSLHEKKKALDLTDVRFSPSKVWYVGDREKVDILPARAEGMRTVLVLNGKSEPKKTKADYVIPNIYCLDEVIERIESLEDSDVSS